jgi:hypothetical protein
MSRRLVLSLVILFIAAASSFVWAHEKVKLTGYVVDVMCATQHTKDKSETAMKFAAEHTKECALMEECVKSGYGIFTDGKWYAFDDKGNQLAKAIVGKTSKKENIKVIVEGIKHNDKVLVEKLTEVK